MDQDDAVSTFTYDGEADPDTFKCDELKIAVESHFGTICNLEKLAEGGYHKVYQVTQPDGKTLGIVRVTAPAFPKDKLESEVATLKYLRAKTKIPVPQIYAWNSDALNPVGAEYMIMEKVRGVSADERWSKLEMEKKKRIVSQVAEHLKTMFALRFDHAGSLYLTSPSSAEVSVGPIVSTPFYRALDGQVRVPDATSTLAVELAQYRGPFDSTIKYLQSFLHAELHVISKYRSVALSNVAMTDKGDPACLLQSGKRALSEALELCTIYPGNHRLNDSATQPYSIRLDDFRLSNIMIDEESADVTGFIDFEGATIAPLWECALLPRWLQDPDDPEADGGDDPEPRKELRKQFLDIMERSDIGREWTILCERGKPFRLFRNQLDMWVSAWVLMDMEEWVDSMMSWAKKNPKTAEHRIWEAPRWFTSQL